MKAFLNEISKGEQQLKQCDLNLDYLISNGAPFDWPAFKKRPLESLVHAIISQQLSVKSASAIRKRVHALLPAGENFTPENISAINDEDLRAAGLSQAKVRTVNAITEFSLNEDNDFYALHNHTDKHIKDQLCSIKGVGPWTADIFLMFGLQRFDVFASGDLGLRKAIRLLYQLDELPSPQQCDVYSKKWQPYRTIAAWHLWRTVD
ncbi:MAG: hypothetical protein A6F71_06310 [Cycloclasticus sp. symbiont of Poecilosclerida sp. M]|nr:MAG: hypothetical protein A6F71_06310 [Cycloclasticus sp. symbiont of Poecilosclerida sp. M]